MSPTAATTVIKRKDDPHDHDRTVPRDAGRRCARAFLFGQRRRAAVGMPPAAPSKIDADPQPSSKTTAKAGPNHNGQVSRRQRGLQQHEIAVARDDEAGSPADRCLRRSSRSRRMIRRSRARSASESSIVWFWHTTQRSSPPIARARASSLGSRQLFVGQDRLGGAGEGQHGHRKQYAA